MQKQCTRHLVRIIFIPSLRLHDLNVKNVEQNISSPIVYILPHTVLILLDKSKAEKARRNYFCCAKLRIPPALAHPCCLMYKYIYVLSLVILSV